VNIGLPAQSPSAQTSGALVSGRSLTRTASLVQFDAGRVAPDARGVWNALRCDKVLAAVDRLLAGTRSQRHADCVSGLAFHLEEL
jgi:hypothetical protein